MGYQTFVIQARCKALGFDPGPLDGIDGKSTRAALEAAAEAQKAKGLPLFHKSGLTRIHWHWTGGSYNASIDEQGHYHFMIKGDGSVISGLPVTQKLAHTLNANSGAIGVAVCGMRNAVERPFESGDCPITPEQIKKLVFVSANLCEIYDIPVTKWSTLSHAEVQPTLGIKQRGKWDIAWLPGMSKPRDPVEVGEILRNEVRIELIERSKKNAGGL